MRAAGTLLTALALAGVPVVALLVLAATGSATPLGVAVAIGLTLLASIALALLWTHDLAVLSETVRRLDEDQPISETPALPGLERVGREIERLSRRLAERSAVMQRMRRADEAIVERLPDPRIVRSGAPTAPRRWRSGPTSRPCCAIPGCAGRSIGRSPRGRPRGRSRPW